jgi:hypothetical protein
MSAIYPTTPSTPPPKTAPAIIHTGFADYCNPALRHPDITSMLLDYAPFVIPVCQSASPPVCQSASPHRRVPRSWDSNCWRDLLLTLGGETHQPTPHSPWQELSCHSGTTLKPLHKCERFTSPLSSGHRVIQRSRVRFPALPHFLISIGSGTRSIQPRECK